MAREDLPVARPLRVGVLLSGSGRTLANFLRRIDSGDLPARIVAVASDRPRVRGLEIAREADLPTRVFEKKDHPDRPARDASMLGWLRDHDPQVLCLAGYLSLLDLGATGGIPVLNIHPALLPRFGGKGYWGERVHRAVLEAGERVSGATVHLVSPRYDEGEILARIEVPVLPGDDPGALAARVFAAECELYPRVLRWLAEGRLSVVGGRAVGEEGAWEAPTLQVETA